MNYFHCTSQNNHHNPVFGELEVMNGMKRSILAFYYCTDSIFHCKLKYGREMDESVYGEYIHIHSYIMHETVYGEDWRMNYLQIF